MTVEANQCRKFLFKIYPLFGEIEYTLMSYNEALNNLHMLCCISATQSLKFMMEYEFT